MHRTGCNRESRKKKKIFDNRDRREVNNQANNVQINKVMNKDILIAHVSDGMNNIIKKEVLSISVWITNKCNHSVNDESVSALIEEAKKSGKMQIYICDNKKLDGKIDAFDGTPLYTNGQLSVYELIYNGNVVWSRFNQN